MDALKIHQARLLASSLRREIRIAKDKATGKKKGNPFHHVSDIAGTGDLLLETVQELRQS